MGLGSFSFWILFLELRVLIYQWTHPAEENHAKKKEPNPLTPQRSRPSPVSSSFLSPRVERGEKTTRRVAGRSPSRPVLREPAANPGVAPRSCPRPRPARDLRRLGLPGSRLAAGGRGCGADLRWIESPRLRNYTLRCCPRSLCERSLGLPRRLTKSPPARPDPQCPVTPRCV